MMKFWKNTDGSSLVEVMAAAVVLSILLLITAQGFSVSSAMMERAGKLKLETNGSILSAETGEIPDETENGELIFERSDGVEYRISVTIKRYGGIRILSGGQEGTRTEEGAALLDDDAADGNER
ncbi:prepilin-type N-terminal cleavage/methylation domain-containing protein [Clostridium sp. MCC353]|uniref:PulJ/GspJ family protein n=1 Tax=Clostridium sp. MCC353 TaxID=2592646 RepID=UPI001C02D828|nr:prepilin-type N-terminal cleavage/methylation domain-containing protein [Clostridium sp. MCC353]